MIENIYNDEKHKMALAYVWLDMVRNELIDDCSMDEKIEAIELAQKMIMEDITGIAIYL